MRSSRNVRWRLAALAAVVSLVATACAGTSEAGSESKVLRYGSSWKPTSLDPRQSASFDPIFLLPSYDALIHREADGSLTPGLATEWTLSEDALSLELVLREGVTFQDDAEFDAEAVKANIEDSSQDGKTTASALRVVEAVEVVDPTHVTLRLSEPGAGLLNALSGEAGMMISPDALANEDLATQPVGAGPFRLVSNTQAGLVFEKWDDYWDADSIELDGLDIKYLLDDPARTRALTSGQVDAAVLYGTQIAEVESAGKEVETGNAAYMFAFWLNAGTAPFDDPNVRKAMIHAIDRDAINKAVFADTCEPVVQAYPSGLWQHVDGLEESDAGRYDPELAAELLSEAGYPDGFDFTLLAGSSKIFGQAQEVMQAQLAEIGVTMSIDVREPTEVVAARRKGDFQASFAAIQPGRPDESQFFTDFYTVGGKNNPGGFSAPAIEGPLQQLKVVGDQEGRAPLIAEISTALLEAGPPLQPLCSQEVIFAHDPKVTGIEVSTNYDYEFRNVSIED
jgi:peptide/nickel transport system substrate-binding protein